MAPLESRLKDKARALGFDLVGIAPATEADGFDHLRDWLDRGFAGDMSYMHNHAEARQHPRSILPEVRSVVMVAMNYKAGIRDQGSGIRDQGSGIRDQGLGIEEQWSSDRGLRGKVASYARGADYHDVLRRRLKELLAWLQQEAPGCCGRAVVDTAPLLERDFARRAGLGWFGKNTMLLNKRLGSFFFLGALLLDMPLATDAEHETSHCGTCTACLDACPTQAFAGPYQLDSRRCISYLTIELKGPIPEELRPEVGDWLFGCDVCQDVCPWNTKSPPSTEPALQPRPELRAPDLINLLNLTEEAFRLRFRGTALTRPRRRGLLRNAAIALGNRGDVRALPALRRALEDPEPIVRDAAQWAIAAIQAKNSRPSQGN